MHADVAIILTANTRRFNKHDALEEEIRSRVSDIMLPLVDDVIDYYNDEEDSAGYLRTVEGKRTRWCRIKDFDWFADNLPYWMINHDTLDELEVQDCYDYIQDIITNAKKEEAFYAERNAGNEVWICIVDVHI